jgi:hypothetical protein
MNPIEKLATQFANEGHDDYQYALYTINFLVNEYIKCDSKKLDPGARKLRLDLLLCLCYWMAT